jgi:hypothetical protein
MFVIRRIRNDETGATAIIVASMMLLLIGMAALVIDIGFGMNENRQDQTSADTAVMAGALEIDAGNDAVIASVKEYARKNLDTVYTNAEWDALWVACTDPGRGDVFAGIADDFEPLTDSLGVVYDCISSAGGTFLRVKVPVQLTDTTFGKLFGLNQLSTDAFAIASITPEGDAGDIIPFGFPAGVGDGHSCIKTAPGGLADPPCDGPSDGNFFMIDSPLIGNPDLGTTRQCGGNKGTKFETNLAVGLDHGVFRHIIGTDLVMDICDNGAPNQMNTASGTGIDLRGPLYSGTYTSFSTPARLLRGTSGTVQLTERVGADIVTYAIDNAPLWSYLTGSGTCDPTTYGGLTADAQNARLDLCISSAVATSTIVFSAAIKDSPRYGFVPIWRETGWPSGVSSPRTIDDFRPVFLNTLYFNCSSGTCGLVFTPGEFPDGSVLSDGPTYKQLNNLKQISAFTIPEAIVPLSARIDGDPGDDLAGSTARLFR